MSPVLMEFARRRAQMERSGVKRDRMTEFDLIHSKTEHQPWPMISLRFIGLEEAPTLRAALVKVREKEWVLYVRGTVWAARRTDWELISINGHEGDIRP